jgi:hypothetical protein
MPERSFDGFFAYALSRNSVATIGVEQDIPHDLLRVLWLTNCLVMASNVGHGSSWDSTTEILLSVLQSVGTTEFKSTWYGINWITANNGWYSLTLSCLSVLATSVVSFLMEWAYRWEVISQWHFVRLPARYLLERSWLGCVQEFTKSQLVEGPLLVLAKFEFIAWLLSS